MFQTFNAITGRSSYDLGKLLHDILYAHGKTIIACHQCAIYGKKCTTVVISDVSFEVKKPLIVSLPGEGEARSLQPSSGRVSADLLSRLPGRLPHHPQPDGLSDVVRDRGGGHDRPGSPYHAGPVQLSGGLALCCQCPLLPSGLHSLEPR